MSSARRFLPLAFVVICLVALGTVVALNRARAREVDRLTALMADPPAPDATSPTGYAGGMRVLLAPGHNNESYQWIAQTQAMLAAGQWRVRQAEYDNAPAGRPVYSPSPYRWWLAAVARVCQGSTGLPLGAAVERGALWADPVLQLLLVALGSILVAMRFGAWPAAGFAMAAATLYPFGGTFLPGGPDDIGLALLLAIGGGLVLLAGALPPPDRPGNPRRWFIAAGVLGGLGLWVNVGMTVPLLLAVGLGGIAGEWLVRRTAPALPWRAWGLAGAVTSALAWLVEYAPAHLSWWPPRLTENHLYYALAWWGGAELLARAATRLRGPVAGGPGKLGWATTIVAAVVFLGPAVILLATDSKGFLAPDTFALRLSPLDEAREAPNVFKWMAAADSPGRALALVLPLALLIPAGIQLARRATDPARRRALAVVTVPAIVALGFAIGRISWWSPLDGTMLAVLVVLLADRSAGHWSKRTWPVLAMLPGIFLLAPRAPGEPSTRLRADLAERDFAHWLARHAGETGAIALAPPNLTVSLYYHGGQRGLGTPYRDNDAGFLAAVRLAGATTADEAQALVSQRQVTHIVIPPWDAFLDEYARLASGRPEHSLMELLHRWLPHRWLRPVAYYLPTDAPWEEPLVVFEAVDLQDGATALSRLAEYFLDLGNMRMAALAARSLGENYGSDLGARIAQARVEIARRDGAALTRSLDAIEIALKEGSDEALAWDRRVSLALVLAEGGRTGPARNQVQRCLELMGEPELRSLSEPSLFRFLTLCHAFGIEVDAELLGIARGLLPPTMRGKI
jgi:hypothetical protein